MAPVIAEVGRALSALLYEELGREVQLSLDAPVGDMSVRVDVSLFDLAEDVTRRQHGAVRLHDEDGRVVGVRPPPRYIVLSYAVTAWAVDPLAAHGLLDAVLQMALRHPVLPPEHLASIAEPVTMALRDAPPGLCAGLGIPLKAAVCLAVTVPVTPDMARPVGPPVGTGLRLSIADPQHRPALTEA
ncbi:hypothetical protein GCM10009827_070630 [Dactylosporangium maewongense]|uniref:Pvc16 N-terminal domain-containing protein n=1 Tax=Dactylosporangium maewongense TaxID=634393 RepID=A0ABN2BL05_9ACTN